MQRAAIIAAVLALLGGAWGLLAGPAAIPFAVAGLAGAALAVPHPAVSCAVSYLSGASGFFVAGADWTGPAILLFLAAFAALVAVPSPFADEIARENERAP